MGARIEPRFESGEVASLSASYQSAEPFPHIHLESFLDPAVARRLAQEFPQHGSAAWTQYKHYNENKLGLTKREHMPDGLGRLVDELNGPEFTTWLSQLTGIPKLIADPSLEGRWPAPERPWWLSEHTRGFHRASSPPQLAAQGEPDSVFERKLEG